MTGAISDSPWLAWSGTDGGHGQKMWSVEFDAGEEFAFCFAEMFEKRRP